MEKVNLKDVKMNNRVQVGIGTLIVFIALVLVAAIAAGVLLDTAGFLQTQAEQTGEESSDQVTDRIEVLQAVGVVTDKDGNNTLGGVELVATQAPGAGNINLTEATIRWVDSSGAYNIVIEDIYNNNTDGMFAHRAIADDDRSLSGVPVITSSTDRVRIVIDIAKDEAPADNRIGAAYDDSEENDTTNIRTNQGGIPEGETAVVRITTASGATTTVQLQAPDTLNNKTNVTLQP